MRRRDLMRSLAAAGVMYSLRSSDIAEALGGQPSFARKQEATAVSPNSVPYFGVFEEASPLDIKPRGWLQEMLNRQLVGLASHHAVSGYPYDTCLWTGSIPKSDHGEVWWPYEQTAYLIDGLERLGIVTGNGEVAAEAHKNIEYVLCHPGPDGSLGPGNIGGTNWPHAVLFRAFLAEYAVSGDARILSAMSRHYLSQPASYGCEPRDVSNIEEMLRIYSVTGNSDLLTRARQTYDRFNQLKSATSLENLMSSRLIKEHGVTFNETAKLPALLYLYTGDSALLDAAAQAYYKVDRDHMLASGLHSAEEEMLGNSPDLYHETCNISDYTWSVGYLLMATGDARWADHIEKAVFNAGLGSISKDFKSHQYFSTPNQVVAAEGIETIYDEFRVAYRPGHVTECCSGNVHRFLPNYVLRQWMRTPRGGIVATLYGAGQFSTRIRDVPITISQETEYPFSETIDFIIRCRRPVAFALNFRIPGWTLNPELRVNEKIWPLLCIPGSFETIFRTFQNGDRITLHLPMPLHVRRWNGNGISIERGPLVYALKIKEDAKPEYGFKTAADFPAWDIRPASPWNYGLNLRQEDITAQVQVIQRPNSGFPWDMGSSPIELVAPAMRVDGWDLPEKRNPKLPENPKGSGAIENVALVPYGSTRIRMTVFPDLC